MAKRTKIVATIGPSSEKVETLSAMLEAGLNIARLNFSHGSHEEHLARVKNVRIATEKMGVVGGILQDLAGPKIRIGDFATDSVELVAGREFIITTDEVAGNVNRVSLTYKELPWGVLCR